MEKSWKIGRNYYSYYSFALKFHNCILNCFKPIKRKLLLPEIQVTDIWRLLGSLAGEVDAKQINREFSKNGGTVSLARAPTSKRQPITGLPKPGVSYLSAGGSHGWKHGLSELAPAMLCWESSAKLPWQQHRVSKGCHGRTSRGTDRLHEWENGSEWV